MFHGPQFIKALSMTDGCSYRALEAGHWVTHFQPDICKEEVIKFCVTHENEKLKVHQLNP